MQIDCRNLDCPKPVVKTRDALKEMSDGETLEILLNTAPSFANVAKFLTSNGLEFASADTDFGKKYTVVKTKSLTDESVEQYTCDIPLSARKKAVFLKDCKIGDSPIGDTLIKSFLGSIVSMEPHRRPAVIVCVNQAVILTTNRAHPAYSILKELAATGVRVLSCGTCLEAMGLVDKLGVGEMSNAYEIMSVLLENDTISL